MVLPGPPLPFRPRYRFAEGVVSGHRAPSSNQAGCQGSIRLVDHEQQLADTIGGGGANLEDSPAVLAQSQALVSLVSQLAQGTGDVLVEAAGRQRLQRSLRPTRAVFAAHPRECHEAHGSLGPGPSPLPHHGQVPGEVWRFQQPKHLALTSWMVALASDHLARGAPQACADMLALLQMVLDQANLDQGDFSFAWMLGLQADPPGSLYQDVSGLPNPATRAFTPLADQKWVTIALSFLKEVEAINTRRGELSTAKRPQPPPSTPALPKPAAEEQLSKKQARAAAWAAKRAAASK